MTRHTSSRVRALRGHNNRLDDDDRRSISLSAYSYVYVSCPAIKHACILAFIPRCLSIPSSVFANHGIFCNLLGKLVLVV